MAAELLNRLTVVTRTTLESIRIDGATGKPVLDPADEHADANDTHNHPRLRRALIMQGLQKRIQVVPIDFMVPSQPQDGISVYETVHSPGLLSFLTSACAEWEALGEDGRDPNCALNATRNGRAPPLIPCNVPLPRDPYQKPSKNVMGKVAYYCTDLCTPIVSTLLEELVWDAAVVQMAVERAFQSRASYAVTTHPGHHAAHDSFGGYCYINHAAHASQLLQAKLGGAKVAILDVDYHCGNGTASIFYNDPSVLMVSLHCDPDFEYPFHSGFADQTGIDSGVGTTLHIPLAPGTSWKEYQAALEEALQRILDYGPKALVVSLGLDTHEGDEVSVRRAGFRLKGRDYWEMGQTIGRKIQDIPTVFIQEGGYKMDVVGDVAADVVVGYCAL